MPRITKIATPKLERNPRLHLKRLYEFKLVAKRNYTGEDQEILLEAINRKIKEIKQKIDDEDAD